MIKTMLGVTTCLGSKGEIYVDMVCLLDSMVKMINKEEDIRLLLKEEQDFLEELKKLNETVLGHIGQTSD